MKEKLTQISAFLKDRGIGFKETLALVLAVVAVLVGGMIFGEMSIGNNIFVLKHRVKINISKPIKPRSK